jgi:MFS transporter
VFLSGQAVSLLGDGLAVLAIPLLVLGLTRSPLISALSAASVTLGYLAVGLPAGVVVDRLDAWRVVVVTDAMRAVAFAALYLLWVTGAARLWVIMTIALAAGAASVFFETALVIVVKDLFPGHGLIRANSILELASQAALVAGPAVVGVLAAAGELGAALLADAATFAVSLVTLLAVRGNVPHTSRRSGGWQALTADFGAGIAYLLSVRVLVIMTVMQIIVNLCLATEKLMFFYARDTLGLSAAGVGAVVAAGGVGGIAGALSATWLAGRAGQIRLVVLTIAASGLAIGSVSFTHSLVTLCAANLAYLWAITVASLANRTYRQLIVPRALLGRVTAAVRLLFLTADPLGVVIAGSLATAIGSPRPVFLGAGLLVAVTAAAGWRAGLRRAGPAGPGH